MSTVCYMPTSFQKSPWIWQNDCKKQNGNYY
jgi:hypothetical protein